MAKRSSGKRKQPTFWTEARNTAFRLVFEGRKPQAEIAEACHVSARTLRTWIAHPDFQAALQRRRDNLIAALDDRPYVRKERRVIALAEMAESARREYEARPWLREMRPVGSDPDTGEPIMLTNEHFNRDAHAAFRESLNDIARELGERGSNVTVRGHVEHSLIPTGAARDLADELLAAVRDLPDARERLAATLLREGATEP